MLTMKGPRRLWLGLVIAAVLIAGHGMILYYVSSHIAASTAVVAGVIAVVLIKHLGLLGPFYAIMRKRRRGP
jgi:hypothetical protein